MGALAKKSGGNFIVQQVKRLDRLDTLDALDALDALVSQE
jgi:hypothetical protein